MNGTLSSAQEAEEPVADVFCVGKFGLATATILDAERTRRANLPGLRVKSDEAPGKIVTQSPSVVIGDPHDPRDANTMVATCARLVANGPTFVVTPDHSVQPLRDIASLHTVLVQVQNPEQAARVAHFPIHAKTLDATDDDDYYDDLAKLFSPGLWAVGWGCQSCASDGVSAQELARSIWEPIGKRLRPDRRDWWSVIFTYAAGIKRGAVDLKAIRDEARRQLKVVGRVRSASLAVLDDPMGIEITMVCTQFAGRHDIAKMAKA